VFRDGGHLVPHSAPSSAPSAHRRPWAALAGLAAGLGFLTKGPIAVVLPAIVTAAHLLARTPPRRHSTLACGALPCLSSASRDSRGTTRCSRVTGTAYLQSFFVGDNLERFATTRYNDARAVWYYVPILLGGLLPWTMFLLVLPWRPARAIARRRRTLTDVEWRLPDLDGAAAAALHPLNRQAARYILPVLPPIAIMLRPGHRQQDGASDDRAASRELTIATALDLYPCSRYWPSRIPALAPCSSPRTPQRRGPASRVVSICGDWRWRQPLCPARGDVCRP
jgi:4-amino-4-deoxy-L-arabinose transferase-like glycosyltransferase